MPTFSVVYFSRGTCVLDFTIGLNPKQIGKKAPGNLRDELDKLVGSQGVPHPPPP